MALTFLFGGGGEESIFKNIYHLISNLSHWFGDCKLHE